MSNVVLKRCKQFGRKLTVTGNFGRPVGQVNPQTMRVGRINHCNDLSTSLNFIGLATNNVVANDSKKTRWTGALGLVNKRPCF